MSAERCPYICWSSSVIEGSEQENESKLAVTQKRAREGEGRRRTPIVRD